MTYFQQFCFPCESSARMTYFKQFCFPCESSARMTYFKQFCLPCESSARTSMQSLRLIVLIGAFSCVVCVCV